MVVVFHVGCQADYFLMSGTCIRCPANSVSSMATDSQCICETNRVTASNSMTTTSDDCNTCAANTYLIGQSCNNCPANSMRNFGTNTNQCNCLGNTATANGDLTTTSPDCSGKREQCYFFTF